MNLSDLDGLRLAIQDFLQRDDLANQVDAFIALAESQINRDVRHWRMERREPITLDQRYVPLPADWVETIRLVGNDRFRALQLASTEALERLRPNASAGIPIFYRHTAGDVELFPVPADPIVGEILYYGRIPPLTDLDPVNWLLQEAPDVYLYGALLQTAPYLVEDERTAVWGALYAAAIQRLNQAGQAATMSGTTLKMRPPR
jgi:hypothetical protein